jgi:hypothetical protein
MPSYIVVQPSISTALTFIAPSFSSKLPSLYLVPPLLYDVVLGLLGLTATLTAASDFASHRRIRNPASGALDDKATITKDEMLEHSFYQVLRVNGIKGYERV